MTAATFPASKYDPQRCSSVLFLFIFFLDGRFEMTLCGTNLDSLLVLVACYSWSLARRFICLALVHVPNIFQFSFSTSASFLYTGQKEGGLW